MYNPLAFLIENTRDVLIFGKNMSIESYSILYISSIIFYIIAMKIFQKSKKVLQMSYNSVKCEAVIQVEHITKIFRIYNTPKDRIKEFWQIYHAELLGQSV